MKFTRILKYHLIKYLHLKVYKWDGQITVTSNYFYLAIRSREWYILPTIHIDYRPWNNKGERYIIFFYWLNILLRNE